MVLCPTDQPQLVSCALCLKYFIILKQINNWTQHTKTLELLLIVYNTLLAKLLGFGAYLIAWLSSY